MIYSISSHEGLLDLLQKLREVLAVLINELYSELLSEMKILDDLFSEFNNSFTMIMMRLAALRKKNKKISDYDLIPVRTILEKNIKLRLPAIRERQKAIDEKLVEIVKTEAVLSRKIKELANYEKEDGKGFDHLAA